MLRVTKLTELVDQLALPGGEVLEQSRGGFHGGTKVPSSVPVWTRRPDRWTVKEQGGGCRSRAADR